jgi:hypothetical protein
LIFFRAFGILLTPSTYENVLDEILPWPLGNDAIWFLRHQAFNRSKTEIRFKAAG